MPFGLKGAAQTFQRLMDSVLRDLAFIFVYLDDILVASPLADEHLSHLKCLDEHGLIVNTAKCQFGLPVIDFLGHCISSQGAVPLPSKVQVVADSTGCPRLVVPVIWRHRVFDMVNSLSHPGVRASASLRAALSDPNWVDRLPWVMLGLRSAPKEDLDASPAELVLRQPLRVPGEFLPASSDPVPFLCPPSDAAFAPVPVHHFSPQSFVPAELGTARFVFVRHDAHRSPLQPPYDGLFRVLEAGSKSCPG
ncbi:hypothetical protein JOB18_001396 [Solea senegalensis]|uniref:Reverse transcriptase domain-containing protein n=1 Tax=Solea senegalensis TaxID=28829 RepID=A0AAV6S957_SOLSE|nr:hypothetical protein JOB18_001396 [Solea senegalensis]